MARRFAPRRCHDGPVPRFPHAVASFDPTDTQVLLWTRVSGDAASIELVVGRDARLTDVVHRSTHRSGPDTDGTVVVDVEGLEPATSYWYRFTTGGERSPTGRTRTLPGTGAEHLRLGLVSCARYSVAPLGVYRALAEREVDLVVHLGDYIYEDDGDKGPREHDPPRTAVTLDDYRRRLAQIRSDPDTQALHLRHPVTTIWDDHDLSDNAWRTGAKHHDPERDGDWEARVRAAAQARAEWLPSRRIDPSDPLVTWRTLPVGDLAELILLDTRFAGRDQQAGDDATPDLDDPERSLLGTPQRTWLEERLRDPARPWAIVASSVVVNELELPWPRALAPVNRLLPNGYAVLDGRVLHDDQWDGYPAERQRLAGWLRDRGRHGGRTLLLSGDVHSSWGFEGPCDDESGEPVAVEMTVPAVSSAAMGRAHYPGLSVLLDRAVRRMDHVRWAEVTRRGYGILDVTRDRAQFEWWFVMPYEDDPAAGADLGAALVTGHAPWPPRLLETAEPTVDPERAGLPADLPPRPDDLPALRRRRRLRLTAEGLVPALVAGVALALRAARRARRARRTAHPSKLAR
jgi:alkaline phosphatase D